MVSSLEEEVNSQETPSVDRNLKEKALEDFKPRSSDTHRSDKRRCVKKTIMNKEKTFKKAGLLKAKKRLKVQNVSHSFRDK